MAYWLPNRKPVYSHFRNNKYIFKIHKIYLFWRLLLERGVVGVVGVLAVVVALDAVELLIFALHSPLERFGFITVCNTRCSPSFKASNKCWRISHDNIKYRITRAIDKQQKRHIFTRIKFFFFIPTKQKKKKKQISR